MWTSALSVYGLSSQTPVYQFGGKMVNDDGLTVGYGRGAGSEGHHLVEGPDRQGLQPQERRRRRRLRVLHQRQGRFHDQRSLEHHPADCDQEAQVGRPHPVPQIGDSAGRWAGSHQFVLPRQINPDANKAISQLGCSSTGSPSSPSTGPPRAWSRPATSVREIPEFAKMGAVTEFAKEIDYVNFVPPDPGCLRRDPSGTPPAARRCWVRSHRPGPGGGRGEGQQDPGREQEEVRMSTQHRHRRTAHGQAAVTASPPAGKVCGSITQSTPYLLCCRTCCCSDLCLGPGVFGVWISLHDWDFMLPNKPFIGLQNYGTSSTRTR